MTIEAMVDGLGESGADGAIEGGVEWLFLKKILFQNFLK